MRKICNLQEEQYKTLLLDTLDEISSTVSSTLGPNGKTCILYNGDTIPHVTKDGVTVAEFIHFSDPFKEAINQIVKETARKTGEKVGDGTTTSILLACSLADRIIRASSKPNSTLGKRHILDILEEVETSIDKVIDGVRKDTIKLDLFDDNTIDILKSVIYMSSNGDNELTGIIADILMKIGPDGIIDVKESNNELTSVNILEGLMLETPTSVVKTINIEKPYIVLVSTGIEKVHQIKSLLQIALNVYTEHGKSIIVVAKEFSKEIQDVVTINNRSNRTSVFLVESDGFANGLLTILDDMASLLNCKIMSTDNMSEYGLQNITVNHMSNNVLFATVSPNQTILQSDKFLTEENIETKKLIISEIAELKRVGESKIGEISFLQKRLSKFSKSATIYVGGFTDAERLEKKDRADDAVKALEAAVNGGIVPGGGYTIYKNSKSAGSNIVKNVCKIPAKLLSQNVNVDIFNIFDNNKVMDFATKEVGNPIDLGILDPANVLIKALQQAMVIVKLLLNTHSIIIPDNG